MEMPTPSVACLWLQSSAFAIAISGRPEFTVDFGRQLVYHNALIFEALHWVLQCFVLGIGGPPRIVEQ